MSHSLGLGVFLLLEFSPFHSSPGFLALDPYQKRENSGEPCKRTIHLFRLYGRSYHLSSAGLGEVYVYQSLQMYRRKND